MTGKEIFETSCRNFTKYGLKQEHLDMAKRQLPQSLWDFQVMLTFIFEGEKNTLGLRIFEECGNYATSPANLLLAIMSFAPKSYVDEEFFFILLVRCFYALAAEGFSVSMPLGGTDILDSFARKTTVHDLRELLQEVMRITYQKPDSAVVQKYFKQQIVNNAWGFENAPDWRTLYQKSLDTLVHFSTPTELLRRTVYGSLTGDMSSNFCFQCLIFMLSYYGQLLVPASWVKTHADISAKFKGLDDSKVEEINTILQDIFTISTSAPDVTIEEADPIEAPTAPDELNDEDMLTKLLQELYNKNGMSEVVHALTESIKCASTVGLRDDTAKTLTIALKIILKEKSNGGEYSKQDIC